MHVQLNKLLFFNGRDSGFVRVLENLESHGILFISIPGLESHGILCRVMENHGKLYNYKKKIRSRSLLCIMIDKNFTECILRIYKDGKSHGIFCNLRCTNTE